MKILFGAIFLVLSLSVSKCMHNGCNFKINDLVVIKDNSTVGYIKNVDGENFRVVYITDGLKFKTSTVSLVSLKKARFQKDEKLTLRRKVGLNLFTSRL